MITKEKKKKTSLQIIPRIKKSSWGALGFFLKLIINCKYIFYRNGMCEWMTRHEDKANGGWREKVHDLADEIKEDSFANGLVKTQLWASFHMRADTRRTGYQYFRAGIIHDPLWHRTKGRRGGVQYQCQYNVAPWSFYLQFLPAECPKIGSVIADLGLLTLIQS